MAKVLRVQTLEVGGDSFFDEKVTRRINLSLCQFCFDLSKALSLYSWRRNILPMFLIQLTRLSSSLPCHTSMISIIT